MVHRLCDSGKCPLAPLNDHNRFGAVNCRSILEFCYLGRFCIVEALKRLLQPGLR
jgi:hypothetical protein